MQLLTTNSKLAKCEAYGYLAVGLELAPGKLAGRGEACPARGDCYKTCIFSSGFGSMTSVRKARIDRHRFVIDTDHQPRIEAMMQLIDEIKENQAKARRKRLKLAVRLNTFSDYEWERMAPEVLGMFPLVQFYDYTKRATRAALWCKGDFPSNYHLTFSCSENNTAASEAVVLLRSGELGRKMSVAVAMYEESKDQILDSWALTSHHNAVDGDLHDATFLHPNGSMILLSAKGKAGSRNPKPNKFLVR